MFMEQQPREQFVHFGILLTLLLATGQPANGQATGAPAPSTPPAASATAPYAGTLSVPAPSAPAATGQAQSPFQGSVPAGQPTGTTLALSLKDAFARALKYN